MRGVLKYGVPVAAGLATGGYALSQGEDPGSAILAGAAGGLGGAAGLLGARALAGKYAPNLREAAETHLAGTREDPRCIGAVLTGARKRIPADRQEGLRAKTVEAIANKSADVLTGATDPRCLGKLMAAALVPGAAIVEGGRYFAPVHAAPGRHVDRRCGLSNTFGKILAALMYVDADPDGNVPDALPGRCHFRENPDDFPSVEEKIVGPLQ